ncbi:MAG: hypothetical protein A3G30_05855 [Chlamydiae bacterium RIFCSPLOWO2_12_FULL_49_12]|nr:MAG: hypothetical protein A3I15_04345 [Chlamydiae bacterium RIFCSPLOWO2_02_FULL_49_12]OGN73756.1 MAG: hypothetical protein A3G30_05855 [Chlamydiae bacterium RIFCSPLOWO2_12_FULL_49_12]
MSGLQKFIVIIGRICLSFIFLLAAVNKLFDWNGFEDALTKALTHSLDVYSGISWLHDGIAFFVPWTSVLLLVGLVFELVGSLFLILGIKVRFGALLLILFLIPATFFFHAFWAFSEADRHQQMIDFLQNLSIFGGLLLVMAYGSSSPKSRASGLAEG